MHDGARATYRVRRDSRLASRVGGFFCWPHACSLSSSSSSTSQSPSARGRRRTPASAPKPHSCRAFCRGADKPPPLMLHLRLFWLRVSFGAVDGATLPLQLPAPVLQSGPPHHWLSLLLALPGPLLLGWQELGMPRGEALLVSMCCPPPPSVLAYNHSPSLSPSLPLSLPPSPRRNSE